MARAIGSSILRCASPGWRSRKSGGGFIASDKHSTVWDGNDTLFDFNYLALGVPPDECFRLAYDEEEAPGEYLTVNFARHYTEDKVKVASLTEHDAESFRRRITGLRDRYGFENLTDRHIALFTPERIKRFLEDHRELETAD
jgi:hypothetical protein